MRNLLFALVVVGALLGLLLLLQPHATAPTSSKPATQTVSVVVKHGKAANGEKTTQVKQGTVVTFDIVSDTEGELHLHGYDKHADLVKGKHVGFTFTADKTGHFEYEFEDTKTPLGALEVLPNQ